MSINWKEANRQEANFLTRMTGMMGAINGLSRKENRGIFSNHLTDNQTRLLAATAQGGERPKNGKGGRPKGPTGKAKPDAVRAREYRLRQKQKARKEGKK